nr:MAG TPA: hypothetical protein [Caudoviricetes sp.]
MVKRYIYLFPTPLPYRLPYNCQNNNNCRVIFINYFLTSLFFISKYLMKNRDAKK